MLLYLSVPPKALFCPLNKALNDEEIVYFGTILMIKTCFGAKLVIYAVFVAGPICRDLRAFGGTNQAINYRVGDTN